jgi:D-sedoheptulose 7-phosphate isomerase
MVNGIRVLALDIDGVLTDGTASSGPRLNEARRFSFQDLDAVTQAQRAGLIVALVTGEDGPGVDQTARRFGIEWVVRGAKDKVSALSVLSGELGVPLDAVCYVGDGDRDAPALARVGLGLAPANATLQAKAAVDRVLSRPGGAGAVAEAVTLLFQLGSDEPRAPAFEEAMRRIVTESLAAHQRLLTQSLPQLARVALTFLRTIRSGHKILLFGNGGSAADAQHVAAELVGRFAREREPWAALALTTDSSILTAVSNDWEFADVFARQVRALARPGDVAAGISTSGCSPNVLRALEAARVAGAVAVGFTGENGGAMRDRCDLCFCAPAQSTARIQELHLLAWHSVCELVEAELTASSPRLAV